MNGEKTKISHCKVRNLPKESNSLCNLSYVQNNKQLPFEIKRVYYIYDVPCGSERGGHAHKELYQLILAASGSFDVILDDTENRKIIHLASPYQGLIVVPGIWREITNFSSGAICLVLASSKYLESDYIRNFSYYQLYKNGTSNR